MLKFFSKSTGRWLALLGVVGLGLTILLAAWFRPELEHAMAADGGNGATGGKAVLGFQNEQPAAQAGEATATIPVGVDRRHASVSLTGTLTADERSEVASNATGIVAEVRVDRGSLVRKGDVLVQLDPTDAENRLHEGMALVEELRTRLGLDELAEPFDPEQQPEVRMARASMELATSQYKRSTELHHKRVISTEVFDQVRTEYESSAHRYRQALSQVRQSYQAYKTAQTRLATLRKAVADTTILAPFDGLVAEKHVALGEQVSNGPKSPKVVTLVRIHPLRLSLSVPQQSIGSVREGQEVVFEVDSYPGREFRGQVRYISPVVTSDTRTLIVEAVVDNADGALRPGLFAKAQLLLPEERHELYVPPSAVQRTGEVARVFVVRDGIARERVVSIGGASANRVEIRAGLDGTETLVSQADKVRDGERVR
jgi:multidrug efflux pump subunit AcrA (membrane-fusion protein)